MIRSTALALGLVVSACVVPACSGAAGAVIPDEALEGPVGADGSDGAAPPVDEAEDAAAPGEGGVRPGGPRAVGVIVLGETHAAGGAPSAVVQASFLPSAPPASTPSACQVRLAGCDVVLAGCAPPPPPPPGEAAPPFDAGPLAFAGTTLPLTLFPPYAFEGAARGAPFLGGAEVRVQAQGAAEAGFQAFDERFVATRFIQTRPALDALTREQVFGRGPLRLGWVPGGDAIAVTVGGAGGVASCAADDALGALEVAREVVDRVRGEASVVTVSVSRRRIETRDGLATKGSLPNQKVEPVGRLELVTSSTETTSFQGCGTGLVACGDACVALASDAAHCGACGVACGAGKACERGACVAACERGPETTLARCSDGCSNDGDTYVDCDDFDCCPVRKDCPVTTACGRPR